MINSYSLRACSALVLGLSLTVGCSHQAVAPPETPSITAAPTLAPRPVKLVSPHVSVSDEIVAACKLHFDNVKSAPKFDFDQSALVAEDNDVLGQIATCVTSGPLKGRALDLVGRADPRGGSDYNAALGERRAGSVGAYLAGLGVEGPKLIESSRGELDATGTDELGWQRDRRVDILLH